VRFALDTVFERKYERLKRLIAICLVLLMAVGMVTVSASPAGSIGDPLISRRHLEGAFAESLRTEVAEMLESSTGKALSRLYEIYLEVAGYIFAPRFTPVTISAGETLLLGPGASFVLLSGSASLTVSNGTVIDVATGNEAVSGLTLLQNHRYFCAENTMAGVTALSAATGLVDGFHYLGGTIFAPQTPAPPPELPPPAPQQLPFVDVPSTAWFRPAVEFVFQNGLFAGTGPTTFSPNAAMTRGMFVTVLHRLDGLPEVGFGGAFSDVVNPEAFYFNAVTWANINGIVTGFEDGTFRPNMAITREQMASIMHRYAAYRNRSMIVFDTSLDTFPDRGNVSHFALESMQWAVTWQIIRGTADGRLMPRNTATRAEVAQIILNYTEHVGT